MDDIRNQVRERYALAAVQATGGCCGGGPVTPTSEAEVFGAALYDQEVTVGTGLLVGALVGAGIAAAASLGHRLFAGQGLKVWAIEVGGDILGLTLIGGVLSFWL